VRLLFSGINRRRGCGVFVVGAVFLFGILALYFDTQAVFSLGVVG
jgi:hypothetical protein